MKLKRNQPLFQPPESRPGKQYPHTFEVNEEFFLDKGQWHFDRSEEPKRKIMIDLFTPSKKNKPTP